jgi:hypothetical protein
MIQATINLFPAEERAERPGSGGGLRRWFAARFDRPSYRTSLPARPSDASGEDPEELRPIGGYDAG